MWMRFVKSNQVARSEAAPNQLELTIEAYTAEVARAGPAPLETGLQVAR